MALLSLAGNRSTANAPVRWPGAQPDGSMLLPNQWSLRPAGTQSELGDFPVNLVVHPTGKFAAVQHCGPASGSATVGASGVANHTDSSPPAENGFYRVVLP